MNSRAIVIGGILSEDLTQVRLPKYDHVVETFPSDRADQSLDVRVLPRRARGDGVCTENPIRIDCVTESPKRQRR
jgi:hypothetical protein